MHGYNLFSRRNSLEIELCQKFDRREQSKILSKCLQSDNSLVIQRQHLVIILYWRLTPLVKEASQTNAALGRLPVASRVGRASPTGSQCLMSFILTQHLLLHHLVNFHHHVSLSQLSSRALEMFLLSLLSSIQPGRYKKFTFFPESL